MTTDTQREALWKEQSKKCFRGTSYLWGKKKKCLTLQNEKYLPLCVGSEYREKCCTLAHFTGRVLTFMKDMKLSKVIPRKKQNEANET